MVIEEIMNVVQGFIEFLFSWLDIPDMPQEVIDVLETLKVYIMDSMNLLGFFFDMKFFKIIVGCWISMHIALIVYKIILWILNLISKFT